MSLSKKLVGCCSVCDKAVFDIIEIYPAHHPYAGEPRRLGAPQEDALQLQVLLSDGQHIGVTVCSECMLSGKVSYNDLWERILFSWGFEVSDENCKALNKPVYTEKQKVQLQNWLTSISKEMILGVMCSRPWRKIENA